MCSFWVAFFVTNYTNLIASIGVGVSCWYNNALEVSVLCASFIKPCVATIGAVPVFNITVGCACCCYCINMCECMCSIRVAFFVTNCTNLIASIGVGVSCWGNYNRSSFALCTLVQSRTIFSTCCIRIFLNQLREIVLNMVVNWETICFNFPHTSAVIPTGVDLNIKLRSYNCFIKLDCYYIVKELVAVCINTCHFNAICTGS